MSKFMRQVCYIALVLALSGCGQTSPTPDVVDTPDESPDIPSDPDLDANPEPDRVDETDEVEIEADESDESPSDLADLTDVEEDQNDVAEDTDSGDPDYEIPEDCPERPEIDRSGAWVVTGTGVRDFEELTPCQPVPIIRGIQGGTHVWGGIRAGNFDVGEEQIVMEYSLLDGDEELAAAY